MAMPRIKITNYWSGSDNPFPNYSYYYTTKAYVPQAYTPKQYDTYNPIKDYNDPFSLTSIADILTNKAALRSMSSSDIRHEIPWFDEHVYKPILDWAQRTERPGELDWADIVQPLMAIPHLTRTTVVDPIIAGFKNEHYRGLDKFSGFAHAGMNILMNFSETVDLFSNPIKGILLEEDGPWEGFKRGSGLAGYRKNYDLDEVTGNKVLDFAISIPFEIVVDPLNWITWGTSAVAKRAAKQAIQDATEQVTKQLGTLSSDVLERTAKLMVKYPKLTTEQAVERTLIAMQNPLMETATTQSIKDTFRIAADRTSVIHRVAEAIDETQTRTIVATSKRIRDAVDLVNKGLTRSVSLTTGFRPISYGFEQGREALEKMFKNRAVRAVQNAVDTLPDLNSGSMFEDTMTVAEHIRKQANLTPEQALHYTQELYSNTSMKQIQNIIGEASDMLFGAKAIQESLSEAAKKTVKKVPISEVYEYVNKAVAESFGGITPRQLLDELDKLADFGKTFAVVRDQFRHIHSEITARQGREIMRTVLDTTRSYGTLRDLPARLHEYPDMLAWQGGSKPQGQAKEFLKNIIDRDVTHYTVAQYQYSKAQADFIYSATEQVGQLSEMWRDVQRFAFQESVSKTPQQPVMQALYNDLKSTLQPVFDTMTINELGLLQQAVGVIEKHAAGAYHNVNGVPVKKLLFLSNMLDAFTNTVDYMTATKAMLSQEYEQPLFKLAQQLGLPQPNAYIKRIPLYETRLKIDLDPNVSVYHGKRFAVDMIKEEIAILNKYELYDVYQDIIFGGRTAGELVEMGYVPTGERVDSVGRVLSFMFYGSEADKALAQSLTSEAQAQVSVMNLVQRIMSTTEYEPYRNQILRTVYGWRNTNVSLFPNTIHDVVEEAVKQIEGNYGGILSGGNSLNQLFDATYKHAYLDTAPNIAKLDSLLEAWEGLTKRAITRDNSDGLYNLARRVALDDATYNGQTLKALRGVDGDPFYYAVTTDSASPSKGNLLSIAYWHKSLEKPQEIKISPAMVTTPTWEDLQYLYRDTTSDYTTLLTRHMEMLRDESRSTVEAAAAQLITEARTLNAALGEHGFEMVGFNNTRFDDMVIRNSILQGHERLLTNAYDSLRKVDIWDQLTRTIEELPIIPPETLRNLQSELTQYLYDLKATHPYWLVPEANLFPRFDTEELLKLRNVVLEHQDEIVDSSKLLAKLDAVVWELETADVIKDNPFNNSFFKYNRYTGEITTLTGAGYHNMVPTKNIMDVVRAPDGTQALEIHKVISQSELRSLFPWFVDFATEHPIDAMELAYLTEYAMQVDVTMRRFTRTAYNTFREPDTLKEIQEAFDSFFSKLYNEQLQEFIMYDPVKRYDWMYYIGQRTEIGYTADLIPPEQAIAVMYSTYQNLGERWRKAYLKNTVLSDMEYKIMTGRIFDPRVFEDEVFDARFWEFRDAGGMYKSFVNDSNLRFYKDSGETIDRIYNMGKAYEDVDSRWATQRASEILQLDVLKVAHAAEYSVDPKSKAWQGVDFDEWFYNEVTQEGKYFAEGRITTGGVAAVKAAADKAEAANDFLEVDSLYRHLENIKQNLLTKDELNAVTFANRVATFSPEYIQDYLFTAGGRYTIRAMDGTNPGYKVEMQKIIDSLFARKEELLAHNINMTVNGDTGRLYMWLVKNEETTAQWTQFIEEFRNGTKDLKHIFSMPEEILEHVDFIAPNHQKLYEKLQEEMSRFSGGRSLGTHFEIMDYKTIENMEMYFPAWMANEAFSMDDLRKMNWIDGLRFNRTVGGNLAARRELLPNVSGNLFKNALNAAQSLAAVADTQTKMTALMFDGEGSIRGPFLADLSNEELLQAIHHAEPNYHLAVVYATEEGLTNVRAIHKPTLEQLAELRSNDKIFASILSKQQYIKVFDVLNKTEPLTATEIGFFSKHIVDAGKKAATLWKVGYLTSPGFLIRNAISSTFKSLMQGESLADIPGNFKHLFNAIKLTKDYDTTFKFILKNMEDNRFSLRVLDALYDDPANASKLLLSKEQFRFIYNFMEQGPSAGLTGLQKKVVDQMIAKQREINGEHKSLFEYVANNPVSNTLLTWNSSIEQVIRLHSLLISVDNGYIFSEAITELIRTHFDQSTRTKAEYIADYVFPFFHFKKENLFYWLDMLQTKPYIAPLLGHIFNPIWNFSEYDNDELFKNRSLQYHILQGNIIFDNNFVVKLSPSVMDTFNMLSDPSAMISNLAVYFRIPVEQLINGINDMSEEDWKHMFWTNVPLIGPTLYKYWDLPQLVDRLLTDFGLAKIQEFGTPIGTATKAVERISGNDIFSAVSRLLGAIMPSMFGAVNRWDDRDFDYFRRYYPRKFYTKKHYVRNLYPRRSGGRGYRSRRRYYPRSRRPKRVYHRKQYIKGSGRGYVRKAYPQKLSKAYFHGTYAMNTWASKAYAPPISAQIWKIQMAARTHNIRMFGSAYKHADYLPHKSMREILRQPKSESKLRVWQMMRYRDRRKNPLKPKDGWTLAAVRNYGSRRG